MEYTTYSDVTKFICDNYNGESSVERIEDNLVDGVEKSMFIEDLENSNGTDIERKFKAVCSSSALCVNNFAPIAANFRDFQFKGYNNFVKANFEREFKLGIKKSRRHPSIDFTLESNDAVVAFEVKYLELLYFPADDNREVKIKPSHSRNNLPHISRFWLNLIKEYSGKKCYLDVSQLIKQAIGLMNYTKNTNPDVEKTVMVYLYWTPKNAADFPAYAAHEKELKEFSAKLAIQDSIDFIAMSFDQFWSEYKNDANFKEHFEKVKERYDICVDL